MDYTTDATSSSSTGACRESFETSRHDLQEPSEEPAIWVPTPSIRKTLTRLGNDISALLQRCDRDSRGESSLRTASASERGSKPPEPKKGATVRAPKASPSPFSAERLSSRADTKSSSVHDDQDLDNMTVQSWKSHEDLDDGPSEAQEERSIVDGRRTPRKETKPVTDFESSGSHMEPHYVFPFRRPGFGRPGPETLPRSRIAVLANGVFLKLRPGIPVRPPQHTPRSVFATVSRFLVTRVWFAAVTSSGTASR